MKLIFFSTINNNLITPVFTLNNYLYILINSIMILLLICSLLSYKHLNKKTYLLVFLFIILETIYSISFYVIKSSLILFSSKLFTFILSIHINEEIYLNKKSAKLLTPFILWEFYLTLVSIIILFLNT